MPRYGGLALKKPTEVPLDSLVRLRRSYEERVTGAASCTRDDVLLEIGRPEYQDDSWCLATPDDEVLAWAAMARNGATLDADLTALPCRHGASAARTLLRLLLDRADELAAEHGLPYGLTVGGILQGDQVTPSFLEEAGFVHGPTSRQYDVGLTAAPLPPVLPDGGVIRRADTDDFEVLHALHRRSLTEGPRTEDPEAFRAGLRRLSESGGVTLLLAVDGHPVGYAAARAADGEGRVLQLAVTPASRGLGVGLALVLAVLAELRDLGVGRALVTLDTGDPTDHDAFGSLLSVQGSRVLIRFRRTDA
ncbi:GNAT family N-acetyltransferase [Streptomyces sp. SM13]|uniref:GNAT family N-acetyltransferase n=1 Tax=Streptomyces sp. SM13 TaxID=1983803 RepID=UPI000CD53CC4|nr:GNAT family N-acetyltransferase [Streptomyces sp. SM13]